MRPASRRAAAVAASSLARSMVLPIVLSTAMSAMPSAQCQPVWLPGPPIATPGGVGVVSLPWDPDGAGPAPPLLVVGGAEFDVGGLAQTNIAAFDGTQWLPLGNGPTDWVGALAVFNGELVAAGNFVVADNQLVNHIARWNGSSWQPLGSGTDAAVYAMCLHQGELVVAGNFTSAGGLPANHVARWNGASWSALGSGTNGRVRAVASFNGSLYAGGSFSTAGGVAVNNLAQWNGTNWLSTPGTDGEVFALAPRIGVSIVNSFLFASGAFTHVGALAADYVAQLSGSTGAWTAMGAGLPGESHALFVRGTGLTTFELVAGAAAAAPNQRVLRWGSGTWNALGSIDDSPVPLPRSLAFFGGRYVVVLEQGEQFVRSFDGTDWAPLLGAGIADAVEALATVADEVVLGGRFRTISGTATNGVARWDGTTFAPLGAGLTGGAGVRAIVALPNGHVIVGGDFTAAGGVPSNCIARWDGASWSPLGVGVSGPVEALALLPNDDVVVGGSFTQAGGIVCNGIARWDGSTWHALGAGMNARVDAVAATAAGQVIAGGEFTNAGGLPANRVARWDGASWSPLGGGVDGAVFALAVRANGDVVAGGQFAVAGGSPAGRVARWDGVAWNAMGASLSGDVHALLVLPDGDVVAGGNTSRFPGGGVSHANVARFHSGAWTAVGIDGDAVFALAPFAAGGLVAGGVFRSNGSQLAGDLARLVTPCPATSVSYGVGCVGSAGLVSLDTTSLPWLGGTFRARGTGLPALSFALAVTGFAPVSIPLAALLPGGGPGCDLLAAPDLIDVLLPAMGVVATQIVLPPNPALMGGMLRHQLVALELSATGAIAAITSSNGLSLTIGVP